jgi:hypothetical protein
MPDGYLSPNTQSRRESKAIAKLKGCQRISFMKTTLEQLLTLMFLTAGVNGARLVMETTKLRTKLNSRRRL